MEENIFGISCLQHDGSLSAVRGSQILFAAHSERYSRIKNDASLCGRLVDEAVNTCGSPDRIVYYERPFLTRIRRLFAGQIHASLRSASPVRAIRAHSPLAKAPIHFVSHHRSHAAGGYFTSPFDDAAVIVMDGVGELESATVWRAKGRRLEKLLSIKYPNSLGIFYAAFTRRIGLKPNEEEFILMAMAAFGKPRYKEDIKNEFLESSRGPGFYLKENLHRGVDSWRRELKDVENIASSVQMITEEYLESLFRWVSERTGCPNLVYSGGVALNCLANAKLASSGIFRNFWILPNPGDAGSSLGAILAYKRDWVRWDNPYLGHDIRRLFDVEGACNALLKDGMIGVANGRAEFGPRALGNRSLLADPRDPGMKEKVNEIKQREPFRPFAPVVLSERADKIFEMPFADAPYMQFAVKCRYPEKYPAICHFDSTSRVQTVNEGQNPNIYRLLAAFEKRTGCPLLLNTSLNVKGEPIVNTWAEAEDFSRRSGIRVF